jgi:hypothetical protein
MGIDPFSVLNLRIPDLTVSRGTSSLVLAQKCLHWATASPWGTKMHEIINIRPYFTAMNLCYVKGLQKHKPFGKVFALPIPELLRWRHHDAPREEQTRIRSLGEGNQVLEKSHLTF